MANSRETITKDIIFNIKTKITNAERAASEIKNALSKINVSEDLEESLSSAIVDLTTKIDKLKGKLSSTMSQSDIQKWNKQWNGVSDTLNDIVHTVSSGKLSQKDVIFDETTQKRIDEIEISLKRIADNKSKITKNVGTRTDALVSGLTTENRIKTAKDLGLTIQAQKEIYSATFENLGNEQAINDLLSVRAPKYKEIIAAQQKLNSLIEASKEASALKDEVLSSKGRLTNKTKQKILGSSAVDTTGLDITSNKAAFLAAFDKTSVTDYSTAIKEANAALVELQTNQQQQAYASWSLDLVNSAKQLASTLKLGEDQSEQLKQQLISLAAQGVQKAEAGLADFKTVLLQLLPLLKQAGDTAEEGNSQLKQFEAKQTFFSDIQSKITQIFGLTNAFQILTRFIRASWTAIKELDAAFTKIAVVTDFTTGDLWKKFDTYNKMAQQLGVTTTDAIETSALYYQQGLETADVMTLTTETIKMARIANMDFAKATKAMTSAIRGFKLEMSDAQTITDTYSALAAEAAVDTDQLATAISKTASIAGSAGLTLENTSAFLTQIIETTQEAPETAGTALKTIIARFTELKKNPAVLKVDVEGEEVSANKVEEALKTADVALRDTEGNFRDLGDVFLELSSKWNSLDRNAQRYIATTAAGSRQQSRFIAMMDNYKRTMELVGIANDSAGAGAVQFAKTLDSIDARVNKLKSNFVDLIGNLVENETVKGILDILNEGMTILVNASEKGIVAFGALVFIVGKAIKSALTLVVGQFSNVAKKNEELRTKIGRTIKTAVVYQPDLTLVNEANAKLKAAPISVGTAAGGGGTGGPEEPSDIRTYTKFQQKRLDLQNQYAKSYDNVIAKQKIYQNMLKSEALNNGSVVSQAHIQNAKKVLDSAIKDSRTATWKLLTPTIATTVSSGFIQGMMTGIISGDWRVGLATGVISTVSSALSNPVIISAIGGMLTKSGGTVATALKSIGGALSAAVPYVLIAAGVAAIGYAFWTWVDPIQSANRKLKKAQDNLDKINNSLESSRANFLSDVSKAKSISDDIEAYKKLSSQVGLTTEEQESLNETVTKLAEQFPQIITGYTQAGQVIIDQKTNWREILELQKESIALSQTQYASDVVASVDAKEEVRKATITDIEERKENSETSLEIHGKATTWDKENLRWNYDLTDEGTVRRLEQIAAYEAQLNVLEKQGVLYAQEKANAYKQIADSLVSTYQASTIKGSGKVDSQISGIAQNELARRIEGLGLDWNTEDEQVKKDNRAKARVVADEYLIALQDEFESSNIDMTKVAEHMTTDMQEQFISFLEGQGITAQGENATLYATLMLDFDTENAGVEQVLAAISGTPYTLKGNEQEIAVTNPKGYKSEDITSVISKKSIAAAIRNKGAQAGADYVQGLYEAIINDGLDAKIADYLAGINITTQQEAKDAASYIAAIFGIPYTAAVDIVFNYKTDPEGNIDKQGLFDSTGIKSFFEGQIETNSADEALKSLNSNLVDFTPELTKALVEEFPELSGVLKTFANDSEKGAEAVDTLRNAIGKASNSKKAIGYFKKLSEQIEILNDTTNSDYARDASKEILKDSLDITDLTDADNFIDTYLSDIEAAANGNVEAWGRVQTAIQEAKLAEIGYGTLAIEDQDTATDLLNQFTGKLDELSNGDYSADFALNGVDYTDQLFTDIINNLADLLGDTDAAIAYLETLGGISIVPSIEQVSVPPPGGAKFPAIDNLFMAVPKITYTVKKKEDYDPDYVDSRDSGGGGGGSNDYETKVDKYYNEINAIEKLNTELEKLAELREKGNLSPEEYRNNINQTAKYYKELQDKYHDYSEKLRADRAKLETEVADLKLPNAISMKDGKLSINKAAIDAITDATIREKIDNITTGVDKLNDVLKENSDAWWEAKYALEELADKYLESFISAEDKIRDVLIKQDQDRIEATEKKYNKLKEADEDYLKALKDNIDKRRRARDKETDYSDLAKKEKRLALLKRDTSGVYGAEILSLEEEIAQTRRELSDKEVDDMVDSLEEQATTRADAYDKELKEMQELQKDKEKSMVEYNKEVDKIMQSGAENVLEWLQTYDEKYIAASETARKKYLEGWKNTINEANGYINNVVNGTVVSSQDIAAQKAQGVYSAITAAGYSKGATDIQSHDATGAYNWYNSYIKGRKDLSEAVKDLFWQIVILKSQWEGTKAPSFPGYSEGGIVNTTGLAMVHGTTTKPEAFLSAADTKNFQILMELLNKAVGYKGGTQSDIPNALQIGECQIIVEVGSIADDYDVDQAIDKVKQSIIDNSNYRNVNIVTRKK